MAKAIILCDLIASVGTYLDGSGNQKSKSRKIATLHVIGNRLYALAPADVLNPTVAAGAQRASALYKRGTGATGAAAEPDYDVNLSLMTPEGKPLTALMLKQALGGGSSSGSPDDANDSPPVNAGNDDEFEAF